MLHVPTDDDEQVEQRCIGGIDPLDSHFLCGYANDEEAKSKARRSTRIPYYQRKCLELFIVYLLFPDLDCFGLELPLFPLFLSRTGCF